MDDGTLLAYDFEEYPSLRLISSDDGGMTWVDHGSELTPEVIASGNDDMLGAPTSNDGGGVWRSRDSGRTWEAAGLDGLTVAYLAHGSTYWAVTLDENRDDALVRLDGDAWVEVDTGLPDEAYITSIAADASGAVALAFQDRPHVGRTNVLRSFDSGITWEQTALEGCFSSDILLDSESAIWLTTRDCYLNDDGGWFYSWPRSEASPRAVATDRATAVAKTPQGVIASVGGDLLEFYAGGGGSLLSTGFVARDIVYTPTGPVLNVLSRSISPSEGASTFTQLPAGLVKIVDGLPIQVGETSDRVLQIESFQGRFVATTDANVFSIPYEDRFRTPEAWLPTGSTVPQGASLFELPGQGLVVLAGEGEFSPYAFFTPTGGSALNPSRRGDPSLHANALAAAPLAEGLLVAFRGVLSWGYWHIGAVYLCEEIDDCDSNGTPVLPYDDVRALHVHGNVAYAGASGASSAPNGTDPSPLPSPVFRSTNGGVTWSDDSAGLEGVSEAFSFESGGDVTWVGTDNGVFERSGDDPWQRVGLEGERVLSLQFLGPEDVLMGTDSGLWRRYRGIWSSPAELDGVPVYDIAVTPYGDLTVALATDRGVWATRPLVTVDREAEPPEAPSQLTLSAFPNPASGAVRITAVSPEAEPVRVRVFDVLGREVTDLGEHASGATVTWSGAAPAGIYLVRAETATSTVTTRITRLR